MQVYNVKLKLKVKPAGHLHTATDSLSCGKKTICGSLDDTVYTRYRQCEEVVLLLSLIIFKSYLKENFRYYSDVREIDNKIIFFIFFLF